MKTVFTLAGCLLILTSSVAQLYNTERHNTSYNTAWLSCTPSTSPNSQRPDGHWIMYDLRTDYDLYQMHIWNLNDPSSLDNGLQSIDIDISLDKTTWTNVGTTSLSISAGSAYYTGESSLDIQGANARYVLIYANSNYGGPCYGLSEVKIDVQESVLPVTLINFYADCITNGTVDIVWEVESEYNNEVYTVEKSFDGIHWESIATIQGLNKIENHTYTYNDNNPSPTKTFYRVMQQDFDGQSSYFPLISSNCDNILSILAISPNPIQESAELIFSGKINGVATYNIIDVDGKLLSSGVMNKNRKVVNFQDLAAGTYFLQFTNGGNIHQEKIIKI